MTFDTKRFMREQYTARTQDIPVPDLALFFPKDEKPMWTIRGMEGKELGRSKEAISRNKSISGIVTMLKSAKISDQTEAMEALLGLGAKNTPDNIAERLDHLVTASVAPVCSLDMAVKLCKAHPITFLQLTTAILTLTGEGMEPGELKDSSTTQV